jgi:8-oxo-dGTP pyrophosphatase MutT (NUDIX family)
MKDSITSTAAAAPPALPRITVATVVPDGDRFLYVEELVAGERVVNQPAGHLEPGETLVEAAIRETLEETGWHVDITGLIAVYHWPDPPDRKPVLRFTFAGQARAHDPGRPLDNGILRALWLRRDELLACTHRLRSPLVERSLDDYLNGQHAPLSLLSSIAS